VIHACDVKQAGCNRQEERDEIHLKNPFICNISPKDQAQD
jgi:hypothetical protein